MRKLSILILGLLVITGFTFAQSITVTSPNGGENWDLGSTHNVTWTSSGVTGNVGIKLFQNGASLGYVAENISVSAGTYNWTISNVIGVGPISAGSNYQIQVKQSGVAGDLSNDYFRISTPGPTGSITVLSPNGGETWVKDSSYSVKWESSGLTGNVRIDLYRNDTFLGPITSYPVGVAVESGKFTWEIDRLWNNTQIPPGNDYKIRISSVENTSVSDRSNNNFSIIEPYPGKITITKPEGGEIWTLGSSHIIKWESEDLLDPDAKIVIFIYKEDKTTKVGSILNLPPGHGIENTGTYLWNSRSWPEPGRYVIKVQTYENFDYGRVFDYSNVITIKKSSETVDLEVVDFSFPKFSSYTKITKCFIRVRNNGINWFHHFPFEIKFRIVGMDKFRGGKFTYDGKFGAWNEKLLKGEEKVFPVLINQINWPSDICKITFAVYADPDKSINETNRKNNFKEKTFYRSEISAGNKCGITIFPYQIKIGKAAFRPVNNDGQVILPSDKVNIFMTFRNCCSKKQTFDVNFIFDWTESRSGGQNKNIWSSRVTLEPGEQKPLIFSNIKIPRKNQFKTLAFFSNNYKNRYPHSLGIFYKFKVKVD